jgi:hypothetical protein
MAPDYVGSSKLEVIQSAEIPDLNINVLVKKPPFKGAPFRSIECDRSNTTCSPGTGTPVPGRFANTTRGFSVSIVEDDNVGAAIAQTARTSSSIRRR